MRAILLFLLCLSPLLGSCSGSELVGIHIALEANGSGTLTARALVAPPDAAPAEGRTQGVQWRDRAALLASQGTFADIGQLQFGGIQFFGSTRRDQMPRIRVVVPRGPDSVWVKALTPDAEVRRRTAPVYDPTGKTKEIADAIRIEIRFPDTVVSAGVEPRGRGVDAGYERNQAWLIVPVRAALERGEDLVWDVSWK